MAFLHSGNDDLDIHLAAPPDWTFTTGDTVIGTIVRRSRLVTPEASVWLALRGQVIAPGFSRELLDPRLDVIFRGPLHINPNEDVWSCPFELKLPWSAWTDGETYQSNDDQPPGYEAENLALPRTFRVYGPNSCWAQYYIDAEIRYTLGGLPKKHSATLKIQLKPPAAPFEGFGYQKGAVTGMVQSHQLLSPVGMEQGSQPVQPKRLAFFRSSSSQNVNMVPELHYEVDVSLPKRIQLNNPEPIPLRFRLVLLDKTSDAVHETPPEVALSSVKMTLLGSTYIKGQEITRDSELYPYYSRYINSSYKLGLDEAFKNMASSGLMRIPHAEKEEPLDIGDLLQLTLHSNGLMAGRTSLRRGVPIVPDMKARCTRHTNSLRLDFTITVAGKSEEKRWEGPIEILPN